MTHVHRTNASPRRGDPTATKTRRRRWAEQFGGRWRDVRGAIRDAIESQRFARLDTAAALSSFREWVRQQIDKHVLNPTSPERVQNGYHYTASEIRAIYEHGLKLADKQLRKAGYEPPATPPATVLGAVSGATAAGMAGGAAAGGAGIIAAGTHATVASVNAAHRENLTHAYTKTYFDLVDIKEATVSDAADTYEAAVLRADGSRSDAATAVNTRIKKVGGTRSRILAHVITNRVVNDAALQRYAAAGVDEVGYAAEIDVSGPTAGGQPAVEWETADDDRVCPQCRKKEGKAWPIEMILRGEYERPPLHPRCRCLLRPI